jgi:hypothetical protein
MACYAVTKLVSQKGVVKKGSGNNKCIVLNLPAHVVITVQQYCMNNIRLTCGQCCSRSVARIKIALPYVIVSRSSACQVLQQCEQNNKQDPALFHRGEAKTLAAL